MLTGLLPYLQTFLAFGNLCIMLWALKTFLYKPQTTLETKHEELKKRVDEHDVKIKEINNSLHQGNDEFRQQKQANELMIRSIFALVSFEIDYCYREGKQLSEELKEVHEDLKKYLAGK